MERICFKLRDPDAVERFKSDSDSFMAHEDLTAAERQAVSAGKVGTLFAGGVALGALEVLCRLFAYDNESYVRQLREATGREIVEHQMQILRARAAARKGG